MDANQLPSVEAKRLADMLDTDQQSQGLWQPEELGAVLRHQLSSVIQFDVGGLDPGCAGRLRALSDAEGLLVRSFLTLFQHPCPPVELLELTKQFAKACKNHPDSPLPSEVAEVLYLLSIVVAMVRCGRRITALDDRALRQSVTWALTQNWIDPDTRSILQQGLNALAGEETKSP